LLRINSDRELLVSWRKWYFGIEHNVSRSKFNIFKKASNVVWALAFLNYTIEKRDRDDFDLELVLTLNDAAFFCRLANYLDKHAKKNNFKIHRERERSV
jgi:hypothetical protein